MTLIDEPRPSTLGTPRRRWERTEEPTGSYVRPSEPARQVVVLAPWLEERVRHLLALRPDWDTYGALPLRPDHIVSTLLLLAEIEQLAPRSALPDLIPTVRRGLQLEWEWGDDAVIIRVDDTGPSVYVDTGGQETGGPPDETLLALAAAVVGGMTPPT